VRPEVIKLPETWVVHEGDCLDVLRELPDESVDSCVVDPPYGLEFMGKEWDSFKKGDSFQEFNTRWAIEVFRVLKPGGHLLAFGGTRMWHRLACAIEDSGFEVRDTLSWIYGSGFPKSLDVSKAIDRELGTPRAVSGSGPAVDRIALDYGGATGKAKNGLKSEFVVDRECNTDEARQWSGWGTALKPAHEPIIVARKPLIGTVAANVLAHGVGGLNIDGCRIPNVTVPGGSLAVNTHLRKSVRRGAGESIFGNAAEQSFDPSSGRWPANVILGHSPECVPGGCVKGCPVPTLDAQSGELTTNAGSIRPDHSAMGYSGNDRGVNREVVADSGGASRFFPQFSYTEDDAPFLYCAKASRAERNDGLEGVNNHPTVKPIALLRWLQRLVTPKGGLVLDNFSGSGSGGVAAVAEGFRYLGIEREPEYVKIARERITYAELKQRGGVKNPFTTVRKEEAPPESTTLDALFGFEDE